MTHFLKQGATWKVTESANMDIHSKLPSGTYVVAFHPEIGYYLNEMDAMTTPDRIYGSLPNYAERIINTFQKRPQNTGVLLVGDKGSGKTMLARKLSQLGLPLDFPTIVINAPWGGDTFNKFMQNINQPCVVLLDEFEKVYKDHPNAEENPQEHMLTLLDGVFTSKKLFVLTCNDPWKIDEHMRNRPGRLFYRIDFKGMEEAAIREYCDEVMKEQPKKKEWIEQIIKISQAFYSFNFDMLKALVEESNRYNEEPKVAIKLMNMTPENSGESYQCHVSYKGENLDQAYISNEYFEGNPLAQNELGIRINVPLGETLAKERSSGLRKPISLKSILEDKPLAGVSSVGVNGLQIDPDMSSNGDERPRAWVTVRFPGATPDSTAGGVFVYKPHVDVVVTFIKRQYQSFKFDAF